MPSAIDVATLRRRLDTPAEDLVLIDVRTPGEYAGRHIPGSVNLPLEAAERHRERIAADAENVVLVCQSGERAERGRACLAEAGLRDAAVLSGGVNAWAAAGAPLVEGRSRWALERQVRLVAGSIVLVSVLAGIWWPPAVAAAGFIGAGLTFAALTNTCAMGTLLSKLPYNRPEVPLDVEASLAALRRHASA